MEGRLSDEQILKFNKDGYLAIENFCSDDEVIALSAECDKLIEEIDLSSHPRTVFTTKNQVAKTDDYFMTSGDKIRYFFEEKALDENGKLLTEKRNCFNKIGHALHALNPVYKEFTHSQKVQNVARSLNYIEPKIVQSMFIFKPPFFGGEVVSHRDATFLYASPLKLLGFWFALEDVTLDNGCLWFIPGSQAGGTSRRMIRNRNADGPSTTFRGDIESIDEKQYIPLPVKKGSAVLIHGNVLHRSLKNASSAGRPIYAFHIYDSKDAEWSKENWLQPTQELPFPSLYI